MKTLLRTSLIALVLLGGFASFATNAAAAHVPTMPGLPPR
jgi:hypothetical protein